MRLETEKAWANSFLNSRHKSLSNRACALKTCDRVRKQEERWRTSPHNQSDIIIIQSAQATSFTRVQTPSLPPENLPENNYWLLVCVCKKEMSNGLAMVEKWETKMSVCKGSGRGRSHATRPWMRFLAQWGLAPASLWDWGRPSFPLPLFFSCLWALSSTATLLSGNSSFFSLFLLWWVPLYFFWVFTFLCPENIDEPYLGEMAAACCLLEEELRVIFSSYLILLF